MSRLIKNIVIHCSAGHSSADRIQDYFLRPVSQGGRGWKTGGYHIIIEKDGTIVQVYPFEKVTNGVLGYNSNIINICYVGGVQENDYTKAKDTLTEAQHLSIIRSIETAYLWIAMQGQDITKGIGVVGHRDYSPDQNKNGFIEPYERIKECPSFDAIERYGMFATQDRVGLLPGEKSHI